MAIYKEKDGSKSFRMNPQQGKALRGGGAGKDKSAGLSHGKEDKIEESLVPGLHQKVEQQSEKLGRYDGHDHMGKSLAHHVEIHHGGHTEGSPAMHEGHTHHTITHHMGKGGGGFGGGGSSERGDQFTSEGGTGPSPEITNHEGFQDAMAHAGAAMHDGCPNCEGGGAGSSEEAEADYQAPENEGIPV